MHGPTDEHIVERLLEDNEQLARHNRQHFEEMGAVAVNFMSAPGAGKTTLISATVGSLRQRYRCCVIEGDMVGDLDARRLRELNIKAVQISTGRSCHLDAKMIAQLFHTGSLSEADLVIIENVGNLVCPAEFPLGEHVRVVLLSVTEGDDKALKYPVIFRNCDAVVLTKCDLLPYVDFELEAARRHISAINENAQVFSLSVVSGEGMEQWSEWLMSEINEIRQDSTGRNFVAEKKDVPLAAS